MKPRFLLPLLLTATLHTSAQQITFQKTYGGIYGGVGNSVQQTFDGGYIIVGNVWNLSVGYTDVYLIKTNTNGDTLWTKTYGGSNSDYGYSVQQTTDSGYIVVGFSGSFSAGGDGDVYLIKTDVNGDTLWTKTYGGINNDDAFSVHQTNDGGYVIAGSIYILGLGKWNVFLLKTDYMGNFNWLKSYGGSNDDLAYSVQQANDGGYVIAGTTDSFGSGDNDVYVIKTDSIGDTLWTKTYKGVNNDIGRAISKTTDAGFIIVGITGGGLYLIKIDSIGNVIWSKTYGGVNYADGRSIQQTADGGYIVAGGTNSFGAGNYDIYLIKTNSIGDTLWTKTFGGANNDYAYSVKQTTDRGYIVTGYTASFGAGYDVRTLCKTPMSC
jgi:hypothetical protein